MLETVYVLPMMVFAALLILEMVNFASDSLVWNQDMDNLYQTIMTDANQGTASAFTSATGIFSCSGGKVAVDQSAAETFMRDRLFNWLDAQYTLNKTANPISKGEIQIDFQQMGSGDASFYVVKASYPVKPVILPEVKDLFKDLKVTGSSIYEINFACTNNP